MDARPRFLLTCLITLAAGAGAQDGEHWSLEAVERPTPPVVADAAWVRNPIDRFILARLERAGLGLLHAPTTERSPGASRSSCTGSHSMPDHRSITTP